MMKTNLRHFAALTDTPTPLEEQSRQIAYQAALEGIVLLENDGVLPVAPGKVALYGAGGRRTIKGGTGSGEVNERHAVSIEEGLEQAGFAVTTKSWLDGYDALSAGEEKAYARAFRRKLLDLKNLSVANFMKDPFTPPFGQPIAEEDIAASDTDTCIYVVSRQAGEGSDRRLAGGDNSLSLVEKANIALCARRYTRTILVINVGSSFDMSFLEEVEGINAVVFFAQQGTMGGQALADLLCGKAAPSGKLADSWAARYEDIPFAREYSYLNGNLDEEYYKEGIYVGYRYFDTFGVTPRYPFGYGLSYTTFEIRAEGAQLDGREVTVMAAVTNTGAIPGKETVQLYASCPQTETLPKEYQRLAAFAKTGLLQPGQTETVVLSFDVENLASFRERDCVTVLEEGGYILRLGNSSRTTAVCAVVELDGEAVLSRHEHICCPTSPVEELSGGSLSMEQVGEDVPRLTLRWADLSTVIHTYETPAIDSDPAVQDLLNVLTTEELVRLVVGGGMSPTGCFTAPGAAGSTTGKLLHRGIPNVVLADGPAGVRLQKRSVLLKNGSIKPVEPAMAFMNYLPGFIKRVLTAKESQGTVLYQFTTAFPVELALAQTWNLPLVEEVGRAISREMSAYGVSYWLAPALNIHRNPLCGRNFEYYSEDPLVSGLFAAAVTRGVQSVPGNFVTLKHYACNNQEDNRNYTNANVSERALREIYLRGFAVAVRDSRPGAVMSSYNKVNGVYTSNSYDLQTKVLRNEWGFDGFVMTDWLATGEGLGGHAGALAAGNDLIMPGNRLVEKSLRKALKEGTLSQEDLRRCAANVLRGILAGATTKLYTAKEK